MKKSSLTLRSLLMLTVGVLMGAGTLVVPAGPVHATVVLDTRIRSLDLAGIGNNGPIELHLTPGTDSLGRTVLAPDGTPGDITPGNGQATVVSSFFDVFFDITSDPGVGPAVTTSILGHIAIAAPCENLFPFGPVPPGCTYFGHPIFLLENLPVAIVQHIVFLSSVVFIPPLPGFDFAERFNTHLTFVMVNPALPNGVMNGQMEVDARVVPEPATVLLVLLGVAGATLTRRRSSRRSR